MAWLVFRAFALACVLLAASGCDGGGETEPGPTEPGWQLVLADLPGALISIWGSSATDVWAVGGDAGSGPTVVRSDGQRWIALDTGTQGDLWWVHGFAGGPVFLGGQNGTIVRYASGAFEVMSTPGTGTVFGIWGPSPDDLWAVGGAGQTPSGGFMWRYDGSSWQPEPSAPADLQATATVFKVWGRAADDVWMVGTGGLSWHYDGTAVTAVDTPTTRTLFTVHGNAATTVAVGGFQSGVLLEHDGSAWQDVTPPDAPQMTGVFASAEGMMAAGVYGSVMRRDAAGWALEDTGLDLRDDFHATWIDPDGGRWAVGGQIAAFPLIRGMMIYRGAAPVPPGPPEAQ